jgi:hypothetical protein
LNENSEKFEGGPDPWELSVTTPVWTESCFLSSLMKISKKELPPHFY